MILLTTSAYFLFVFRLAVAYVCRSFFRYCQLNFSRNPIAVRPEDSMLSAPPKQTVTRRVMLPNGQTTEEEIDLLSDYSWRNFFTSINFVRIMQKLSKHRSHRIWLLVQYKSSVSFISTHSCG